MRIPHWRFALLGLLCFSPVFATPCITQSLTNYIALGAVGCTINGVIVDDFNFTVVATNLGSPLTAGAITVTPSSTGSLWQVLFSATGNTTATGFMVSGSQFAQYELDFNWDPLVSGAGDDLSDPVTAPGTATVTTKLCNGQIFGGVTCPTTASATNTLTVFDHGASSVLSATTPLAPPVLLNPGIIGTSSLVDLEGNGSGTVVMNGFDTNVFSPEPGTFVLFAAGILGLMWHFRRRHPAL